MTEKEPKLQAWLACEDILNKLKTELITEAMDTVKEAIDAKLIEVKGSLVTVPDKASDTDMYMFLINNIIEQRESIESTYEKFIEESGTKELSSEKVLQMERLRKFLLCVEKITLLMHYSNIFDQWMRDVAMEIREEDISEIVKKTSGGNGERRELLNYVLKSQFIAREEILTKEEREILDKAVI